MNIEKRTSTPKMELANRIHVRVKELGVEDQFTDQMIRTTVDTVTKQLEKKGQPLIAEEVSSPAMIALIDEVLQSRLAVKGAGTTVEGLEVAPDFRIKTPQEKQEEDRTTLDLQ